MPKSKRKRAQAKAKVPKDFEKKKRKVGKVTTSANHTDTRVTARSITVREQLSAATGSADAATSDRKLGLAELLVRVGHYNEHARKDAVAGLRSLVARHPEVLQQASTLLRLFEKVAPRMLDPNQSVRELLCLLLSDVTSVVAAPCLAPFFPLLLVHTCSAMTAMNAGIRRSALEVLDLWLAVLPGLTASNAPRLIENLLQMISAASGVSGVGSGGVTGRSLTASPSSGFATLRSRTDVLSRIAKVLRAAFAAERNKGGAGAIVQLGKEVHWQRRPRRLLDVSTADAGENKVARTATAEWFEPGRFRMFLLKDLMPIVTECWLEHNPAGATVERGSGNWGSMQAIVDLIGLVVERLAQSDAGAAAEWQPVMYQLLAANFLPHFPVGGADSTLDPLMIASMNMTLCLALARVLPAAGAARVSWSEKVVAYITSTLDIAPDEEGTERGRRDTARLLQDDDKNNALTKAAEICQHLAVHTPEACVALFECIHRLYADKRLCRPESGVKLRLVRFFASCTGLARGGIDWARLPQDERDRAEQVVNAWLKSLPRLLWELKQHSLPTSQEVLSALAALGACSNRAIWRDLSKLDGLQGQLAFAFHARVSNERAVHGPFVRLPSHLQRQMIDLLYHIDELDLSLLVAVAECCHLEDVTADIVAHAMRISVLQCDTILAESDCVSKAESVRLARCFSFVACLAMGYTSRAATAAAAKANGLTSPPFFQRLPPAAQVNLQTDTPDGEVNQFWTRRVAIWAAARDSLRRLNCGQAWVVHCVTRMSADLPDRAPVDAGLALASLLAWPQSAVTATELPPKLLQFVAKSIENAGTWAFMHLDRSGGAGCWTTVSKSVASECVTILSALAGGLSAVLQHCTLVLDDSALAFEYKNAVLRFLDVLVESGASKLDWTAHHKMLQGLIGTARCARCSDRAIDRLASQFLLVESAPPAKSTGVVATM